MIYFLAAELALLGIAAWRARRDPGRTHHLHVLCPHCQKPAAIDVATGTLVRCSLLENGTVGHCDRACLG